MINKNNNKLQSKIFKSKTAYDNHLIFIIELNKINFTYILF